MPKNKIMIQAIRKYQKNKALIGAGRCKHYPTCSNYSIGCYEKFNFFKATFLTIRRIISCNPFTKNTYDPVPLTKKEKKIREHSIEIASEIITSLIVEQYENPKRTPIDDIKFIYQASFGNLHLNPNASLQEIQDHMDPMTEEEKRMIVKSTYIGNGWYRIPLQNVEPQKLAKMFLESRNECLNREDATTLFFDTLYLYKKRYPSSLKDINSFIKNNVTPTSVFPISHSELYKNAIHPHYRIIHKVVLDKYLNK